jgi:uncharacterized protein YndB with AHSA1/START domain
MPSTVQFHRVFRCPPDRAYRAFIDPAAMCKWLPPHGFVGTVHSMSARVGEGYRMSFTNFATGATHAFGGTFVELVPGTRIVYTDRFDDPNLKGEMRVVVELEPVSVMPDKPWCSLRVTQSGIPDVIPPACCSVGWQESLLLLAQLIEADVP